MAAGAIGGLAFNHELVLVVIRMTIGAEVMTGIFYISCLVASCTGELPVPALQGIIGE